MAKQKSPVLGKGLEALLGSIENNPVVSNKIQKEVNAEIAYIPLKDIIANPDQPRKEFNMQTLEELAQSIKENGVIVPITVNKRDDKYVIIAGERRFRASKMAGLNQIPAYIRVVSEQQSMQMALIENIQRDDLNAIEIALTLKALLDTTGLNGEELGKKLGKSRSAIANYVRLLSLPAEIQIALRKEELSMGHARTLINIEDEKRQLELARQIIQNKLSVREAEVFTNNAKQEGYQTKKTVKPTELPQAHDMFLKSFTKRLETPIAIKRSKRGKGTITIAFKNDAEFERIVALLQNK